MASPVQVTCINKTNRASAHERISHIGATSWKHTQAQAISNIESNTYAYYVMRAGVKVDVIVATHNGNKYIKTRNDDIMPDNLLSLPECA